MRLATLAKKVDLTPKQLQEYLSGEGIELPNGSNTKLNEEVVESVLRSLGKEETTPAPEPVVEAVSEEVIPEEPATGPVAAEEHSDPDPSGEEKEVEVIRAPKINLPGLTVKGKIDLPEQKPRGGDEKKTGDETDSKEHRGSRQTQKRRQDRREKRKDPDDAYRKMVAERKRKQKEEENEKRKEEQAKKEQRKRHYEKMMQQKQVKTQRLSEDPIKEAADGPTQNNKQSTNIFQRFWKWLNTY